MVDHPYKSAPDRNFWRKSVADPSPSDVDPVGEFRLKISPTDKVATAGSCFAQHISRYLSNSGFNYYVAEPGHPILPESVRKENNYGVFSARYGNIYTSRQLLQLIERAYGHFQPKDDCWQEASDVFLDAFRPTVQPGGYVSELEMRLDREQHLASVRSMFEELDVLVFTLGLTECWVSRADGAAYPICPGASGGTFDPLRYEFRNETVDEVLANMTSFLMMLARVNPQAQVVLTVSPVPLIATARADQHVLTATTYSKSVLRVAAEMLTSRFQHVHYFPSYEIITGAFNRGSYFADDLRSVKEEGVAHVMRLFLKHATSAAEDLAADDKPTQTARKLTKPRVSADDLLKRSQQIIDVECDEVALDRD
jgi:GSCFA family